MRYADLKRYISNNGYNRCLQLPQGEVWHRYNDRYDLYIVFFDQYSTLVATPQNAYDFTDMLQKQSITKPDYLNLKGTHEKKFLYVIRKEDMREARRFKRANMIASCSESGSFVHGSIDPAFADVVQELTWYKKKDKLIHKKLSAYGWDRDRSRSFAFVTYLLVLACAVVYYKYREADLAMSARTTLEGKKYYQMLTAMFAHANMMHIVGNMVTLAIAGTMLEKRIGHMQFAAVYIIGGLYGNLVSLIISEKYGDPTMETVGASGAILAVMGAMIVDELMAPKESRSMSRVIVPTIYMIAYGLVTSGTNNVVHMAGLAGGVMVMAVLRCIRKAFSEIRYEKVSGQLRTRNEDFVFGGKMKM